MYNLYKIKITRKKMGNYLSEGIPLLPMANKKGQALTT
jgi:hypothetical protein